MRRLMLFAVVIVALAGAVDASADVARYQTQAATLTITDQFGSVYTYAITISPCDNTFTGTGGATIGPFVVVQTISGTYVNGTLVFVAVDTPESAIPGDITQGGGTNGTGFASDLVGGDSFSITWSVTVTGVSSWRNHGDYVSHAADSAAAAHSCIGMPSST